MRTLLLIVCLASVNCTAARRTRISPDGAVEIVNGGQMGGRYTIVYTRSAKGAVKVAEHIDNEKSLSDVAQAAALGYGSLQVRLGKEAELASDTAIATGAQNAGVAGQKIAADEAVALGAQGVETTKILKTP